MSISINLRDQVRQRANFACEYCGVTETDSGGMLTVDHYQPQARGGSDASENLIYCCHRCNEYKSDYWSQNDNTPSLWNPRHEPFDVHFIEIADGVVIALTESGRFTLNRLRLNRPQLIANRLQRRQTQEEQRLLTRLRDIAIILEQLQTQHNALLEENHSLLQEKQRLLQILVHLGNKR